MQVLLQAPGRQGEAAAPVRLMRKRQSATSRLRHFVSHLEEGPWVTQSPLLNDMRVSAVPAGAEYIAGIKKTNMQACTGSSACPVWNGNLVS